VKGRGDWDIKKQRNRNPRNMREAPGNNSGVVQGAMRKVFCSWVEAVGKVI